MPVNEKQLYGDRVYSATGTLGANESVVLEMKAATSDKFFQVLGNFSGSPTVNVKGSGFEDGDNWVVLRSSLGANLSGGSAFYGQATDNPLRVMIEVVGGDVDTAIEFAVVGRSR